MTELDADPARPVGRASRTGVSWWPWLAMLLVLGVALAVGVSRDPGPETAQDRVTAIARTIKCPACSGEAVADSNSAASRAIRADIAERVTAGQSDDQIRAYYAERYGEWVLLTPSGSGISALVWAIPVIVLVVAFAGLVLVFRRWQAEPSLAATDDDRALVGEAIHDRDGDR